MDAEALVWSQAKEGQAITVKGTVVASVTTYEDNGSFRSETEYSLQRSPEDNEPVRLSFDAVDGDSPVFETGDEITIAGTWQTQNDVHAIAVEDTLSIRKPGGGMVDGEIAESSEAIVTARAPKEHKVAVLLIGKTKITVGEAQAILNPYSPGSVAAFFGEVSGQIDTFKGDVFSYPSIDTSNCKNALGSIQAAARNAFQAAGNNLANYSNVAYVIGGGTCGFYASGTMSVPGSSYQGETTFNDSFKECSIIAHEFGHNLGFNHASSTNCGSSLYNASRAGCTDSPYGNTFDIMGVGGTGCFSRHISVMQKRYAGYLSKCEDVTAGGSAVFNLSAAEGSCGMRSLRIPIAGESNYYYLEFRKPGAGEFAGANGESHVLLNVSNDPVDAPPAPYLVDAAPATSSANDGWLVVGTTYNLPGNVTIKVLSIADVAKIQVTMPGGAGAKCQDGTTPPSSGGNVGGLCGAVAAVTYQAEDLTFQKFCTKTTNVPGYNGSGFMDFGGAGSIVELGNVNVPRYGSYSLTFRYANGSAAPRTSQILVNDQVVGTVPFSSTGAWTSWGTNAITVTLKKGINKIRVTSIDAGPNLDQFVLTKL
jgi:hypothetical protein